MPRNLLNWLRGKARSGLAFAGALAAAYLCGRSAGAQAVTLYAAPRSNGVWFGQSPEPSRSAKEGIAGGLSNVVEAARVARRNARPGSQVNISLRAGTYELSAPLVLGPEDSGLTIAAYPGEKVIISGGRRIKDWKRVPGKANWWQAKIGALSDGQSSFRSLFVGGHRAQRARTPNEGFFRIQGESPQAKPVRLNFRPGDIKAQWAAAGDVEVIALLAWADFRMFIRSVDETNHIAILSTNAMPSNKEANARYFIENTMDALDAPGEWYLDRKAGLLTYISKPGEDLTTTEVVAPKLEELLVLQGDIGARRPIQDVVLTGLTFSYTDWPMPVEGYADTQAAVGIHGNVRAEGAIHCAFQDCVFRELGGYAVELGKGCQRDSISGCAMFDLGAGGVRVGEPVRRADPFEQNYGHLLTDNHIHEAGRIYAPAVGIFILQSGSNVVAHNEIDHLNYTAISVGWNWGYQETPCRDNIIEFNHLHDIGQGMLSDMGAVYTLGIQKGTIIRNNLVHDVESFGYGGWGLYTDEGSTDILLENNVVYHCKSAGFHQHYGRENVLRNNIFAFNREHELMRTRTEDHTSFIFTNNIVVLDSGDFLGSNWQGDHYVMDRNIYWDARPGAKNDEMRFSNASLQEWRARGHDAHSLVADPRFVAPEKLDFRLRPESPALKLGFQPIDLSEAGVRKNKRPSPE